MVSYPAWYRENVDLSEDQAAYQGVSSRSTSAPEQLHCAARYYNHTQSSSQVQAWTGLDSASATQACSVHRWTGSKLCTVTAALHSNHRQLRIWLARYRDVIKPMLAEPDDPVTLLKAAKNLHRAIVDFDPESLVWLGDEEELNSIARFDADEVQALMSALGLWHFGEVAAGPEGAILRIRYRLDGSVPLYKPDWRHGYPGFYFACAPHVHGSGQTRDLQTGTLKCKEWVAKMSEIDPNTHIVGAECVLPAKSCNHYDLSAAYIATLAGEMTSYARAHP